MVKLNPMTVISLIYAGYVRRFFTVLYTGFFTILSLYWILHYSLYWILHYSLYWILHYSLYWILHYSLYWILHYSLYWILHCYLPKYHHRSVCIVRAEERRTSKLNNSTYAHQTLEWEILGGTIALLYLKSFTESLLC